MHCLQECHEINAYRLGWVSPYVSRDSYLQVLSAFRWNLIWGRRKRWLWAH